VDATTRKIGGYDNYLKTEYWKNTRNKILKRDNYNCRCCGSKKKLQVHHDKYRGYYKERFSDLRTLCQYCHWYHHSYLKKIHLVLEPIVYLFLVCQMALIFYTNF